MVTITNENIALMQLLNTKIEFLVSTFPDLRIVLGGDFNCSLNDALDRWPIKNNDNLYMLDFINERDLIDIWRHRYPAIKEYTWKNRSGSLQSRIDFWLISDSLIHFISSVKILPTPLTDHKTILLEVCMSARQQPK